MPAAGVTKSQGALSDAAQRSDAPPAFVTDSDWEAGLAPPAWPLNERLPGVTDNTEDVPGAGEDAEPPEHPATARKARRKAIFAP